MIDNTFLAVNKQYLHIGLKSIEILLIAQIEEFERNNCKCYLTNKQFADIFGESESTIKRALNKLEQLNFIKRSTSVINGNGKSNRQRILSMNKCEGQNEPCKMVGSEINNGRVKNDEWSGHNGPIKEKEKENKKDNNIKAKILLNLIHFDDELQEDINAGLARPEECIPEKFYSFAFDELSRLGDNTNFVLSYDKITSYKNGKCVGSLSN